MLSDHVRDVLNKDTTEDRLWLVTGAAGFIGSNLVETLLEAGERVRAVDNFSTGHQRNLDELLANVRAEKAARFEFATADIRDREAMATAMKGVTHVLHQAALGSVPRSLADPVTTNDVNVGGFVTVLDAARVAGVGSFVYAASSSTYGDEPNLPKREDRIGNPLSPYAVTKYANELYANVFARSYSMSITGLRYFNVFGKRQDPDGAYAAVIPKWIKAMIAGDKVHINGDGETSRDFCFVDNAVQANLLAALKQVLGASRVYNVAVGDRTTLAALFGDLRDSLALHQISYNQPAVYGEFRAGDVRHSQADISKAQQELGYTPSHTVAQGLAVAMPWYVNALS